MKRLFTHKDFGKKSGFVIYLAIFVFAWLSRINLIYFESLGALPMIYSVGLVCLFYLLTFFLYHKDEELFGILFVLMVLVIQTYMYSRLQWSVEQSADEYVSMYDWNAAKGLSWIVHTPLTLLAGFLLGTLFDGIKNRIIT